MAEDIRVSDPMPVDERDPSAIDAAALADHPSFASTLANGLAILGCFSGGEPWLGNKDIAQRLGLLSAGVGPSHLGFNKPSRWFSCFFLEFETQSPKACTFQW